VGAPHTPLSLLATRSLAHLLRLGFRRHGARAPTPAAARHELGHAAGADLFQGRVVH